MSGRYFLKEKVEIFTRGSLIAQLNIMFFSILNLGYVNDPTKEGRTIQKIMSLNRSFRLKVAKVATFHRQSW